MRALGLSALGATIPQPPPGFFPTGSDSDVVYALQARSAQGLSIGLESISDGFAAKHLSPPVAASVPLLKTVVSSAANGSLSALATGAIAPTAAGNVAQAVADVLEGALDVVQALEVGGTAVQEAVAEAASAVPVIGAIVTLVVDFIVGLLGQSGPTTAQVQSALFDELKAGCHNKVKRDEPYGTMGGGTISPADFFRKVAFVHQQRSVGKTPPYPFNAAMMYVALCGGETQGFFQSRADWDALLERARQRTAAERTTAEADKLGMPGDTQRAMWKLIVGIMAQVQPPIGIRPVADQGRTLMPLLQDLVRESYLAGQWNDIVAEEMSLAIARTSDESVSGKGSQVLTATCAGGKYGFPAFIDLATPFKDSVVEYQAMLLEAFYDAPSNTWSVTPKNPILAAGKRGAIVLSPEAMADVSSSIARVTGKKGWIGRNLSGIVLAALGAAGGYYGARKYHWLGA